MTRIHWTQEAVDALDGLRDQEEADLLRRLELVERFPEMYPRRQRGRFGGLRYFPLGKRWLVYYRVQEDRAVLVFDIVSAMARW